MWNYVFHQFYFDGLKVCDAIYICLSLCLSICLSIYLSVGWTGNSGQRRVAGLNQSLVLEVICFPLLLPREVSFLCSEFKLGRVLFHMG